ncbi:MAG: DUF1203 domain-containing protein [Rubricella sp.]
MRIRYSALSPETVARLRKRDDHDQPPERMPSDGIGTPCRACLRDVPAGEDMLVLAHRPFPGLQPYAECGPIFLCANCADEPAEGETPPPILGTSPDYLLKGYTADHRIRYGTGAVTQASEVGARASAILGDEAVAYVHVRSARNNCYLCRIDRA